MSTFVRGLKSGSVNPLCFFEVILAVLGPLDFHVHFRISLLISTKKKKKIPSRITTEIVLNL